MLLFTLTIFSGETFVFQLPYESVCMYGHVGEALCHLAQVKNASCVILGNRGLGTIRRTILGSNSDYVIKHATTPVLLVPPEQDWQVDLNDLYVQLITDLKIRAFFLDFHSFIFCFFLSFPSFLNIYASKLNTFLSFVNTF